MYSSADPVSFWNSLRQQAPPLPPPPPQAGLLSPSASAPAIAPPTGVAALTEAQFWHQLAGRQ